MPVIDAALGDAQAADAIDEKEGARPRDNLAEGADVVTDAGRGFAEGAADSGGVGMFLERLLDLLRLHGLAIGHGHADNLDAEGLGDAAPAFAELAGHGDDGLAARR